MKWPWKPHSPSVTSSPLGFILLPMDWIFVGARWTRGTRHEKGLKSEPHSKDSWGARRDEDLTVCFWRENRNARNKENHTQQILRHPQIAKLFLGNGNRTTALGSLYIDRYEETTATCAGNQINPVKFFWNWFLYNYLRSKKLKFHHTTGKWPKNDWHLVTFNISIYVYMIFFIFYNVILYHIILYHIILYYIVLYYII